MPDECILQRIGLFFRVPDPCRDDLPVEGERCLVEIVFRDRRAEIAADVEAVVGGKGERGSNRHPALRNDLTIDLERHIKGDPVWAPLARFDFNFHVAGRQFLFRDDRVDQFRKGCIRSGVCHPSHTRKDHRKIHQGV